VHTAAPEAREDPRGDVQDPYECAGPGDEGGNGIWARTTEYASRPARAVWNLARHFPIYPDRHRIP
jgi:hypothetical protein